MSYYIHHTPGRLRIKTPYVKRNLKAAEKVKTTLRPVSGIQSISINTLTGSVIVHYSISANSKEILQKLKQVCCFDESKAVTHDEVLYSAASNVSLFLSKTVCDAVLETALKESAFSMIAALI